MKLVIAKTAGFCMGVRRAVDMVLDVSNKNDGPICTYGPLIHNPQVLSMLESKGVPVLSEIPEKGEGTVLIRAHGVPPTAKKQLKQAGFKVVDATCPRVVRVQAIIRRHAKKGYASIIIGDVDHAEVVGLFGFTEGKGHVVDSMEALEALPHFDKAIIVAQTTQNTGFYEAIKKWAKAQRPHYKVFDTICDSTEKRQKEIQSLAGSVDAVVVVGGRNSGNTQRLAEVAEQKGRTAFHIEEASELDMDTIGALDSVAITAGASTPNWIIKKVHGAIETGVLKKNRPLRKIFFAGLQTLLHSNIYLALGAGCLSYASTKLQGISHSFQYTLIAASYVLSMHILNHLNAVDADRYNDPDRAALYQRYRYLFGALGAASGVAGLTAAFSLGITPFLILLAMSLMGLSYKLPVLPPKLFGGRFRSISEIPGSKTVLIAAAWGLVTAVLPALGPSGGIGFSTVVALVWSASVIFVRTAFFNTLDIQGDRIVGRETLPILLGAGPTLRLLKRLLAGCVVILTASSILGLVPPLGFVLCLFPVSLLLVLTANEQGGLLAGFKLEFLVESHFIVAGLLTLIWSVLPHHY